MSVNINGKVMKKILIFSLIFLGTLKAVEMAVKTPAGPAEDSEWSISFNELEKSYNQAKVRGVPSLVDLAAKRIADTVSICDPAIQDLPWELINLVAQQWYKKNATRINNLALRQKIPAIKLVGHNGSIRAIAILPNGDIVTGSGDRTAIIWDPKTGKEKRKLVGHNGGISSIAILENGDIVTGSWDGTAIIWDPKTGKEKLKLEGHNGQITSIAILKNGDIVTGSYDRTAIIWDSETGKEKQKLKGHKAWINAIAILPNGDIATGSYDKTARIWNPVTGKEKQKLEGHNGSIYAIAILPNGDIATGSYDGTARIWDPVTGKEKQKLEGHDDVVKSIAILKNGDIVTGSNDKTARIWKISENIKKLFGDNLNNLTLESLCLAEKKFNLMRRPKRSNPSCLLI
ncbi:hypothetical protein A3F66_05395 [candidate division TM6 bacterium RIFCSPHIGHO2_12_FULL_32_22]|nr:MAG: hypothetical protein A3F66_05395 [candidate division TM6 bacterium RIFCSPHIGHO2_12_FULL_32_22]